MHKKNNLFDLIKSLSPSEKRHFKRSLAGSGKDDSNFLLLFDEIDKMDSYSESEIKNTFKGRKFVNQLHVTKIYLQDSILKSLRSFHAASSSSMIIKDLLKNIEICFHKELYNQCVLEIQKAEKLAIQTEDDIALLETLNWKRKLAQTKSPANLNLKGIIASQGTLLQRLNNVNVLWELMTGMSDAKLPDKQGLHSLNEKVLLHHLIYRIEIQHGRNNEAKKCLEELIGILESNPSRLKEEPGLYLTSVNNLLSFLVFTKDHDEALALLSKAKFFYENSDKAKRSHGNFRQILRTYNIELEIYRDTESLEKGISLITDILGLIQKHSNTTPKEYLISLWFQFAYIYFLNKDFKSSLHWINEIMNSSFAALRPDLHVQTHFLNLMVHFELKNFFVMRYFVGSTKRFGKKNQSFKAHHRTLLNFFTKVSRAPESEFRMLFENLRDEIVASDLIPPNELDYINWNKWITMKARKG